MRKLETEFKFAGFTWPRYVVDMAIGKQAIKRKFEGRKVCGGYYHAPKPNANSGRGFYLESAGQPFARYELTEEGFYCDIEGFSTVYGIVAKLPHGRFLAGCSEGVGMWADVESTIYTDEDEARHAAIELARIAAENMQQEAWETRQREEQETEE